MNPATILDVVSKGISLIEAVRQTTEAASPAIQAIYDLMVSNQKGEVTQEQLDQTEALLDEQLALFNAPLPEADE